MSGIQEKIINGARRLFASLKSFINPGDDPIKNAEEEKKEREAETKDKILSRHGFFGGMYYESRPKETDYGREEHPKLQSFSKNMLNRWESARASLFGPRIIIAEKDEKVEDALKIAEEAGAKIDVFIGDENEAEYVNEESNRMRTAVVKNLDALTMARLRTAEKEIEASNATTEIEAENIKQKALEENSFWRAVIEIENDHMDIKSLRQNIATYPENMQKQLNAYYATVYEKDLETEKIIFPTLYYERHRQAVENIFNPETRETMLQKGEEWDKQYDPEKALLLETNDVRVFETNGKPFCGNEFFNPVTANDFEATITHDAKNDSVYIKTTPDSKVDPRDVIKRVTGITVRSQNQHYAEIKNISKETFDKIIKQMQKEIKKEKEMEKKSAVKEEPEQEAENKQDVPETHNESKTEPNPTRDDSEQDKSKTQADVIESLKDNTIKPAENQNKDTTPESEEKLVKLQKYITESFHEQKEDELLPAWVMDLSPDEYDRETGTGVWNISGDNAIVIYEPNKNKVDIQILKDDIEIEPIKDAQKLKREHPEAVKRYSRHLDEYGFFETTTIKLRDGVYPTQIIGSVLDATRKRVQEFNRKPELAEVFMPRGGVHVYEAKHGGKFDPATWPVQFEDEVQADFNEGAKAVLIHSAETGEVSVHYNRDLVDITEDTQEKGVFGYIMEENTDNPFKRVIDTRNDLSEHMSEAWTTEEDTSSYSVIVYDFHEGQDNLENILQMRDAVVNYVSPEIIFDETRQMEEEQRAHEEYKELISFREEANTRENLLAEIMGEKESVNRKELDQKISDLEKQYPHFNPNADDKKGNDNGPGNSSDTPGARGGKGRVRIAPGNDGDR